MKRDHLIPTPIVDKNGNTTVRYMKPSTSGGTASGPIPAPVTKSAFPPIAQLTNRISEALGFNKLRQYDKVRATLETYPDELIKDLLKDDPKSQTWTTLAHLMADKASATEVREVRCFYPHLSTTRTHDARMYVRSLHNYPQLPRLKDYSTADERTLEQCKAILTVTEMMDDDEFFNDRARLPILFRKNMDSEDISVIDEPKIIELIMERPEQAKPIGEIIITRRTRDAELIKELLDHETPALAEGIL